MTRRGFLLLLALTPAALAVRCPPEVCRAVAGRFPSCVLDEGGGTAMVATGAAPTGGGLGLSLPAPAPRPRAIWLDRIP